MQKQEQFQHQFDNGLVLLGQNMPWLQSAAFSVSIPAGCRYDPMEKIGVSNFTCEMVQRGCGPLDSRQFIEELEANGIDYSSSSSVYQMHFGGAMCADKLLPGLKIYADVLMNPHFPDDQLEDGRLVCLQEVSAMQDDLPQQTMIQLRRRYYGQPDGRNCHGTIESNQAITMDDLKSFYETNFRPNGTIISVAGNIDWEQLKTELDSLFAKWREKPEPTIKPTQPELGNGHIPYESQQTQIALAYNSLPYSHSDYFQARGAVGVLSDGMSSRLFHEVREKRGLCYSVFATCHSMKDRACVICYSGTTADRAQETLEVLIEQLTNLKAGIYEDELRRLKVQIRSGLVMQQESCRARAAALAGDWLHLGRLRSMGEITEQINGLTVDSINKYLADNPPGNFSLVTLGTKPLKLKSDAVPTTST